MKSLTPLVIVLALAIAFGVWYTRSRGEFRKKKTVNGPKLDASIIGVELGSRVTMVQFSSAFCSPCRATKALLEDMVGKMDDVHYAHIDAESHLELVRKLDIRSTPTTLFLNRDGVEVGRAMGTPKRSQVMAAVNAIH
ncbi:MAG: thioredoxin family protein [Candidatus Nanopelagicaceae bacterium]